MTRSRLIMGLVPALLLALIVLPFAIYQGALPDPMAIHWNFTGEPDGSMPTILALSVLAGFYVAMTWATFRVVRRHPEETQSFFAALCSFGGLLAAISWLAVLANHDRATWEQAGDVTFVHMAVVVAGSVVVGVFGWLLARGTSTVSERAIGAAPTLSVADPEHAVWSGRGIGRITMLVGLVIFVVGVAMWGWSALALGAIALLVFAFSEVRATVAARGVVVSLGWWGFPGWTVPMASISRAEVETVRPMAYGGWGYRLRPGVRAVVVRGGEGLRLVRADQPDLVLTVDDAATGAGLINAMLGAQRPG